ncbi:hypothetical protein R1flu_014086 [Riccia fluitans]|uniref:F-box domain-containing protein n=1 Tax=Riccia fluitans TaxID=41844 RepID=A0ABD1YFF8_9MARC
MLSRYRELHLDAALYRRYDYPEACRELHSLLRQVYLKVPKTVQLLMYNDILTAFRLLAGLDTSDQLLAASLLVQAAETVLPRQRRSAAVVEYKQAAVAFHRRAKRHDSEPVEFPLSADLLVHIFGFLDARSLVMASAVSRTWYEASTDDGLWRAHYLSLFVRQASPSPLESSEMKRGGCWRKAFEIARQGRSSRLFSSNRAYCMKCKSALWLSEGPQASQDRRSCSHRCIRAMTVSQVVTYVRGRSCSSSSSSSSSSSDTDSEEERRSRRTRLWAY